MENQDDDEQDNNRRPDAVRMVQDIVFDDLADAVGSSSFYVITDSNNTHLVAFKPAKNSYSICVSSPYFSAGAYKLFSGGTYAEATSTVDGLYQGGVYTPGTQVASWTFSTTNVHYVTGVGGGVRPH